jgi:hypothetical protein
MYKDYLDDIIECYTTGKKNGDLPQRLIQPTSGSIKEECVSVCGSRFQKKDLRTLSAFFKVDNDQDAMLRAIHRCDRDRFKPLVNFLKGTTGNTDDLNIELLAWLIDFPGRPWAEEYIKRPGGVENKAVPAKTETEVSSEENFKTDNADTGVITNEQALATVPPSESPIAKRSRLITGQRMIALISCILLLTLVGFYLADRYTSAALPGNRYLKKDDVASVHSDTGAPVVFPAPARSVGANHKAGSDTATKQSSLPKQQAREHKVDTPKIGKNRDPGTVVNKMVFTAVDFISFTNPESNADIAVLIIDSNRKMITGVASAVANLYRNKSYSVSTGVFTYPFINSKYVDEVAGGDISILSKLVLPSSLKYIVVGKYKSAMENGQRTRFICRAGLDVTVISVQRKMQVDGFELTTANGYDDEEHARAGATEKLIDQYKVKSTLIKLN